ncbi:putative Tubulin polyglutamylase TTLL13 [Monocercomonoides exilis]|uniref:putative Tubulin polyglutamylase TTLL13 n=1 Tax=Monocercomonoides exilis TaxID=2049356 RepID=UPI00355A1D5E|nr:putative Tubulin polyglutamylase TTLL13 [Monocercomonoides exilis]|eukprot:MONOS_2745.1-p1 / transcript=MONOS_2745.1 / gene=MONOS_2745 / organism=Monocercomonoides_exilis_PA203 / gene_product=Tubulin polyglutamylase TTLL13 / transcript_product=Tubulin polyglutamylase TTLL13 / location=Mono_scaffold00058:84641-87232(-) / protein_length=785 / sequence_SO=supercontig / SO=protein_coding / is_pseudo=false
MSRRGSIKVEEEEEEDDDDPYIKLCTPQSRKAGKKCILLEECRYDIVRFAAQYLDYRDCDKFDHCKVIWTDSPPSFDTLSRMNIYQVMSRFPMMNELSRKGIFFQNINRMRLTFPSDFRFVPRTWVLPQDSAELNEEFALAQPGERPRTYIVKPTAGSQGQGIYLAQTLSDILPNAQVVQRYVDKPFLIDGYKFDFRIYVLVTSVAPLRIWLGREGLARFCTKKYEGSVTRENMSNVFMHLTNYAVNKRSKDFIANEDAKDDDKGSKRSLSSVTRLLKQKGYDVDEMWEQIINVIVKTMLAIQPSLLSGYALHASPPITLWGEKERLKEKEKEKETSSSTASSSASMTQTQFSSDQMATFSHTSQCFHIIGFDILLDYRLRPWIVEINHSPSFVCDSPLDQKIKFLVICSALRLAAENEAFEKKRIQASNERLERMKKKRQGREESELKRSDREGEERYRKSEAESGESGEAEIVDETEPIESPDGFYRLIYSESHPSFKKRSDLNRMRIFNSAVLHESFYKACGVRGLTGLKMIASFGATNSTEFQRYFLEYAERATSGTADGGSKIGAGLSYANAYASSSSNSSSNSSSSSATSSRDKGRQKGTAPSRFGGRVERRGSGGSVGISAPIRTGMFARAPSSSSSSAPISLSYASMKRHAISCSKFCQFGRNAGLSDGKTVTQADLDLLYREVTRHSTGSSSSSSSTSVGMYSSYSSGGGGSGGGLGVMGYGEFCSAVLILATRHYPDLSFYEALRNVLLNMEEKFMKQTPLSSLPQQSSPLSSQS